MAVDEEEDGVEVEDREGQVVDPYPRKPPPSWGEWERDNGCPVPPASVHSGAQEKVSGLLCCALASQVRDVWLPPLHLRWPTAYGCNTPNSTSHAVFKTTVTIESVLYSEIECFMSQCVPLLFR